MERGRESWGWSEGPEWRLPEEETKTQTMIREHRESIDDKIDRTVDAYLESYDQRKISTAQALAEIAEELKGAADRLIASDDDNERDFLAAQRAMLLRTRQRLTDGSYALLVRNVADAPDMPDTSEYARPDAERPVAVPVSMLPHQVQMDNAPRLEEDNVILFEPREIEVRRDAERISSPIPGNLYTGETNPGIRAGSPLNGDQMTG